MGAKIRRAPLDKIIIDGVAKLGGAIHKIVPDRNEAVSYAVAALATKGDIVVENAREAHLTAFLQKLDEIGACFTVADYGIRFWYTKPLQATDIKTAPEPGFMTDWQPLWTLLMTQTKGVSRVIEAVHNSRLQFTEQLNRMGAKISLYQPKVTDLETFYEFDGPASDSNFHGAKITGPTPLRAGNFVVPDLRAGATLTIAALVAAGESILTGIDHIDRGYEQLDDRLRQLGAQIERRD
jgi:UDP-N-acetylglucosamine 1-carboxyvinyltransferase